MEETLLKLKPCPFCGKHNLIYVPVVLDLTDQVIKQYKIVCDMRQDGCGASSGLYWSSSEAEDSWNRREYNEVVTNANTNS